MRNLKILIKDSIYLDYNHIIRVEGVNDIEIFCDTKEEYTQYIENDTCSISWFEIFNTKTGEYFTIE